MRWYRDRKTVTKLMIGFACMGLITALVGWMGLSNMAAINGHTAGIYETQLLPIIDLAAMRGGTYQNRGMMFEALAAKDQAEVKTILDRFGEMGKVQSARREKYEPTIRTQEERDAFAKYLEVSQVYNSHRAEAVLKPLLAGDRDLAAAGLRDGRDRYVAAIGALNNVIDLKVRQATKDYEGSQAVYASARVTMVGLVLGALAFGFALGYVIARLIARPLAQAVEVLQTVAAGDFTQRLDVASRDEVGQMALALNEAVDGMSEALQEVRRSADAAAAASTQLSAATDALATGAQEQASSLEETAASLEEITGTVKQNADNAKQASQLAVGSRDTAEKGGQVVSAAVQAMGEINRASKRIADIITTIDEIAFQTNLLALNAAVEAARAGEQGRGFAVVASEVRNLAQRSASAAKEIKGLIDDSVQKVDAGSALVNQSGETLTEIVSSVKRVTDIIAEIAAASQEQTTGVDQVNQAVTQMDQVVQSNAAQTEELSSTAQSLADQAHQLQALVARFKLDSGPAVAAVSRAVTAAPALTKALPPRSRAARTPAPDRRASEAPGRRGRKTDEPVLAAATHPANGKAQAPHDDFEEF